MYVRNHFKDDQYDCSQASQTPITIHILKAYDESYSKIIREHKYKDKDNDKDKDKDTEKVPATPDIVTPCFPLGDHLATALMCSPYPISSSDTHQHPIGHL